MFRYFFKIQVVTATFMLFLLGWLISLIPFSQLNALDPIGEALSDFQVTDIVYSKFRPELPPDTNIVIVNIGHLPRNLVGQEVRRINSFGPAVIGIDALFRHEKESALDTPLVNALKECQGKVVMVHELAGWDSVSQSFTTTNTSAPIFNQHAKNGYANITNDEDSPKTIRRTSPKQQVGGRTELAFPVLLAQLYRPQAAQRCLARGNDQELINWRGNISSFYYLPAEAVLDSSQDLSVVRNKVVLMAFLELDEDKQTHEDLYFTPVNPKYAGKTDRDMYGIVIHANMLSMILSNSYVDEMPDWLSVLIGVIACYLNFSFFMYIMHEHEAWYDLVAAGFQLLVGLGVPLLIILVFYRSRYIIQPKTLLLALVLGPSLLEIFIPLWERYSGRVFKKIPYLRNLTNTNTTLP